MLEARTKDYTQELYVALLAADHLGKKHAIDRTPITWHPLHAKHSTSLRQT
jgi:hypothetical protein